MHVRNDNLLQKRVEFSSRLYLSNTVDYVFLVHYIKQQHWSITAELFRVIPVTYAFPILLLCLSVTRKYVLGCYHMSRMAMHGICTRTQHKVSHGSLG